MLATERGTWLHGTPWGGLWDDLSNWREGHLFLTRDPSVAERYAMGQVAVAGRVPAGTTVDPTVYELQLPSLRIFDAREPENQTLYERWAQESRAASDPEDWWPRLARARETTSGHFSYDLRIPLLTRLAAEGWQGALFDEGTQGISLALTDPTLARVVRRTSVAPARMAWNPQSSSLHVFDFDGTLFGSPERPSWWPKDKGWWGQPQSLEPPCVPEKPGSDWWHPEVLEQARRSIADPSVYTVLATGRMKKHFSERVPDLLAQQGLVFDEVALATGDSTLAFKLDLIARRLKSMPEGTRVEVWEDRPEHVEEFETAFREAEVPHLLHLVDRMALRPLCTPEQLAARPGSRLQTRRHKAISIKLTKESRAELLRWLPALHAQVFADHVTVVHEPTEEQVGQVNDGEPAFVKLVGRAADDKGQAVGVLIPDFLAEMANRIPHVTISTAKGTPPSYSNELLLEQPWNAVPALVLMGAVKIE